MPWTHPSRSAQFITRALGGELGPRPGSLGAYLLAALMVGAAALLRAWLTPWIVGAQFITFFPALMIATVICGAAAGIGALLLSTLAAGLMIGAGRFSMQDADALALFLVVGTMDVAIISALRNSITRIAQLNINLRDSEAMFRDLLESAADAMVIVDQTGRIALVNAEMERMFELPREALIDQPISLLLPVRLRDRHDRVMAEFLTQPHTQHLNPESEMVALRANGEEFPVEVGLSALRVTEPRLVSAVVRDVTQRRRTERAMVEAAAAAEAANAAKSNFLAMMSHEIRTPLNGVLGMAQIMAVEETSPVQRERLAVIRQSGQALLAVLNDVLDLSKIESGKLALESAKFDLGALLGGAKAAFTPLAAQKGLNLVFEGENAIGELLGDSTRLRQILYNLISNALKFTETGEVRVSAAYDQDLLRLVVADTGIGMAAEALANLFNPFVQADASTTRRYGGTGLGLAISRDLATLMGGAIAVASAPDEGTTFTVSIPLHRPASSATADTRKPGNAADTLVANRFGDIRLLAAEDNPTNRQVLESLLAQLKIRPVFVPDGLAVVEAWEAGDFEVILMDLQMPRMDGVAAAGRIRQAEADSGRLRVPIIGVTADAMAHQVAACLAAGMDSVVTKPIDAEKLRDALTAALARARGAGGQR